MRASREPLQQPWRNRFSAELLIVLLTIVLGTGIAFAYRMSRMADTSMRADLLTQARIVAKAINIESVRSLTGSTDDLESADYKRLKEQLTDVRSANLRCRFTYLIGTREDDVIFFVDSEPADSVDYSPPGQVYKEVSDEVRRTIVMGKEAVTGPTYDRWGIWMNALVPLRVQDKADHPILLGMDVNAHDWNRQIRRDALPPLLMSLLVATILVFFFVTFRRSRTAMERIAASEAAIRDSEERYRDLVENSQDLICTHDLEGNLLSANEAAIKVMGYSRDALLRAKMIDLIDPKLHRVFQSYLRKIRSSGRARGIVRIRTASGETRYWEYDNTLRTQGVPVPIVRGMPHDVTKRRQAERASRESEKNLRAILSAVTESIFLIDLEGNVLVANEEICRRLGTDIETLTNGNIFDFLPQDVAEKRKAQFETVRQSGLPLQFEDERQGRTYLNSLYQIHEPFGKVTRLAFFSIDVTERKKAEKALRNSEELFRGMTEQLLDVVFRTDNQGRITYVSPSAEAMFGRALEELKGQYFTEVVADEDTTKAIEAFVDLRATGIPEKNVHLNFKRRDGTIFPGEVNASLLAVGGRVEGILGLTRDVSERQQAEIERERLETQLRQSQKMEAVGQLAGGVAHDFNNLLQVVLGYVDLVIANVGVDSLSGGWLTEARKAAERAADLTRQLLTFSRRQIIKPVDLDLNELVENVLRMVQRVIGEHIELRFLPTVPLGTLHADKGQIEQVLMNLCLNARDAMPGGGTILIETDNILLTKDYCEEHPWATTGQYVVLNVTDTGCGMDEATRSQIFEPFFTTKEVGQGTGLGLATVYGTIRQHNGMINVYSEPGKGSTFRIYLPVVLRPGVGIQPEVQGPVGGGTETILVAEDDAPVRGLLIHILETAGYTVLAAANGEEAIELFEQNADRIHMGLLDVIMPKLGGREVMEKILSVRPRMRFLFSSGYSENAVHTNFVLQEGLHLISKPYHSNDILRAVRQVLDAPGKLRE